MSDKTFFRKLISTLDAMSDRLLGGGYPDLSQPPPSLEEIERTNPIPPSRDAIPPPLQSSEETFADWAAMGAGPEGTPEAKARWEAELERRHQARLALRQSRAEHPHLDMHERPPRDGDPFGIGASMWEQHSSDYNDFALQAQKLDQDVKMADLQRRYNAEVLRTLEGVIDALAYDFAAIQALSARVHSEREPIEHL